MLVLCLPGGAGCGDLPVTTLGRLVSQGPPGRVRGVGSACVGIPDAWGCADTDPEEAAWRSAVEATPWLVGSGEPEREVPPEELFERLEPFRDRVADDIRGDQGQSFRICSSQPRPKR